MGIREPRTLVLAASTALYAILRARLCLSPLKPLDDEGVERSYGERHLTVSQGSQTAE